MLAGVPELEEALQDFVREQYNPSLIEERNHYFSDLSSVLEVLCQKSDDLISSKSLSIEDNRSLFDYARQQITRLGKSGPNPSQYDESGHQLSVWINQQPDKISDIQDEERFKSLDKDSLWVRLGKGVKRARRFIQKTIHGSKNAFRKVARKPSKEFQNPSHDIPYSNIVACHFLTFENVKNDWLAEDYDLFKEFVYDVETMGMQLFQFILDEQKNDDITPGELKKNGGKDTKIESLPDILRTFRKSCSELLEKTGTIRKKTGDIAQRTGEEIFNDAKKSVCKVGTIELSAGTFSVKKLDKLRREILEKREKLVSERNHNFKVRNDYLHLQSELLRYRSEYTGYKINLDNQLNQIIETRFVKPLADLSAIIEAQIKALNKINKRGESLRTKINEIGEILRENLRVTFGELQKEPVSDRIISLHETFFSDLLLFAGTFPEQLEIFANNNETLKSESVETGDHTMA